MRTRPKILVFCEGVTLAHVVRPLVLASSLDANTYEVQMACGEKYSQFLKESPFIVHDIPTMSPVLFNQRCRAGAPLYDKKTLARYTSKEIELIQKIKPDLVVGDFRVSLAISTKVCGVPYMNLCNAHWSPYSLNEFPLAELPMLKIFGVGLSKLILKKTFPLAQKVHTFSFNALCKKYQVRKSDSLFDMYTRGDWTCYLDHPDLAPTKGLPAQHRYLGSVTWEPKIPMPSWWKSLQKSKPLIYISMGSSGNAQLLKKIIPVLKTLPYQFAISTAGQIELGDCADNIYISEYLPAKKILNRSSLCIFNGGSATGVQALSEGVPLLCFPENTDQFYFSENVKTLGLGELIRPSKFSENIFAKTLMKMMDNDFYSMRCTQMSKKLENFLATDNFTKTVESILKEDAHVNTTLPQKKFREKLPMRRSS